jgi:hypothetical protein
VAQVVRIFAQPQLALELFLQRIFEQQALERAGAAAAAPAAAAQSARGAAAELPAVGGAAWGWLAWLLLALRGMCLRGLAYVLPQLALLASLACRPPLAPPACCCSFQPAPRPSSHLPRPPSPPAGC